MKLFITLFITLYAVGSVAVAQSPTPSPVASPATGTSITDQNQNSGLPPATKPVTSPSPQDYVRPDAAARRKRFINSTIGPVALGRIVFNAGLGTWTNSP